MRKYMISFLRRVLGRDVLGQFGHQLEAMEKRLARTDAVLDILLEDKEYVSSPGVGMNGQVERKKIVSSICSMYVVELVVETGTFFGFTSGFFARDLGLPVKTCEVTFRHFAVAKRLLRNCLNVEIKHCDSRDFLHELSRDTELTQRRTLFYLDAHWYESLPLQEELDTILASWPQSCILIDDFAVPWDADYGYDNYGHGKTLNLNMILPIVERYDLAVFFPNIPASQETGGRRGCVLLASKSDAGAFESVVGLKRYR
jgi:predicted O-methyltransferase YrrM